MMGGVHHEDRNARIVEARNHGQSFVSIAREYGLSTARVRDIFLKAVWQAERDEKLRDWPDNVDVRTINALTKEGLCLVDAPFDFSVVRKIEGIGDKSMAVLDQAGLLKNRPTQESWVTRVLHKEGAVKLLRRERQELAEIISKHPQIFGIM